MAEKILNICGHCRNKEYAIRKDEQGYTSYFWYCRLTGQQIYATHTCESFEERDYATKAQGNVSGSEDNGGPA